MYSCPWGVTAFFDPVGQPALLDNFLVFSRRIRAQGLPLVVVELAFGDRAFQIPPESADRVLRVRSTTVLWHKERLLNLGIAALPASCDAVVWLDGDVLFENERWLAEACQQLAYTAVLQPFEWACWLDAGEQTAPASLPVGMGVHQCLRSFGATIAGTDGEQRRSLLATYERHGHTGFAWMARRTLVASHGLYDRAIVGGGDVVNAHAFAADEDFLRARNLYCRWLSPAERQAIRRWGQRVADDTGGRIGAVPGRLLHLFHGPLINRRYVDRLTILRDEAFDPDADLAPDAAGCWQWATPKSALHARVTAYLEGRHAPVMAG